MANILNWVSGNKEWLFSGLGILAITGVIGFFFKKGHSDENSIFTANLTSTFHSGFSIGSHRYDSEKEPKYKMEEPD